MGRPKKVINDFYQQNNYEDRIFYGDESFQMRNNQSNTNNSNQDQYPLPQDDVQKDVEPNNHNSDQPPEVKEEELSYNTGTTDGNYLENNESYKQHSTSIKLSKYGNKRGRRRAHEKDHNIPLDDKVLMRKLNDILIKYGFSDEPYQQKVNASDDSIGVSIKLEQVKEEQIYKLDQIKEEDPYDDDNISHNQRLTSRDKHIYEEQFQVSKKRAVAQQLDITRTDVKVEDDDELKFISEGNGQVQARYDIPKDSHHIIFNGVNSIEDEEYIFQQIEYKGEELVHDISKEGEINIPIKQEDGQAILNHKKEEYSDFKEEVEDELEDERRNMDEFGDTSSNLEVLIKLEMEAQQRRRGSAGFRNKLGSSSEKQSRSYRLSEDLKIIVIMSEKPNPLNGYSSNYWKQVLNLGLIDRPHESLRDRYKRFIKYLTYENLTSIINWIDRQGHIEGYLNFLKFKNNFKVFSHVSIQDPFASKKSTFSGRKKPVKPNNLAQIQEDEEFSSLTESDVNSLQVKYEERRDATATSIKKEEDQSIKQENISMNTRTSFYRFHERSFVQLAGSNETIEINDSDLSDNDDLEQDDIFLSYREQSSKQFKSDIKQQNRIASLMQSLSADPSFYS